MKKQVSGTEHSIRKQIYVYVYKKDLIITKMVT